MQTTLLAVFPPEMVVLGKDPYLLFLEIILKKSTEKRSKKRRLRFIYEKNIPHEFTISAKSVNSGDLGFETELQDHQGKKFKMTVYKNGILSVEEKKLRQKFSGKKSKRR